MDSWSFNSVVKGFADDDQSFLTTEAFDKDQFGSIGWEVKPPFMGLFPNEINIQNQLFGDTGFPPLMRNSLISENNVSSSKFESDSRESQLFDLKLGRLTNQSDAQILKDSKISHNLSPEVSTPSKRPRSRESGLGSSTPFCKVHGCNKNLSDCKEYHKRHKVCEVHSKTSKVIVNGIEQRFCQQCSRFHVLREFDNGKRSCRKRLSGHNERRRKPHAGFRSQRHGSLFPNIKFEGAISSFPVPNELFGLYDQGKYEVSEKGEMNIDDMNSCITYEQMHSESLCPYNYLERINNNNPRCDGYMEASACVSGTSALSLLSSQSQEFKHQTYNHTQTRCGF